MAVSKGALHAQKFLQAIGIDDIQQVPIDLLVYGSGAILVYKSLKNCDGRIVFGNDTTLITINADIAYEGKKRFTIGHELGHLCMHRDNPVLHSDTDATLEYFKNGHQETEANEFASELLMPSVLFKKETHGKAFSLKLLKHLSELFITSITSVAYRYLQLGYHPICVFYLYDGKVKYYKPSEHFDHWIIDRNGLPPPTDSVAYEYLQSNYQFLYSVDSPPEQIRKSTWLSLRRDEPDTIFYEFCIVTPSYKTILSIIWED